MAQIYGPMGGNSNAYAKGEADDEEEQDLESFPRKLSIAVETSTEDYAPSNAHKSWALRLPLRCTLAIPFALLQSLPGIFAFFGTYKIAESFSELGTVKMGVSICAGCVALVSEVDWTTAM